LCQNRSEQRRGVKVRVRDKGMGKCMGRHKMADLERPGLTHPGNTTAVTRALFLHPYRLAPPMETLRILTAWTELVAREWPFLRSMGTG